MSHTEDLLRLVSEFPDAFSDPDKDRLPFQPGGSQTQQDLIIDAKTQQLLQLMDQFPAAFADSEIDMAPGDSLTSGTSSSQVTTTVSLPDTTQSHIPNPKENILTGYAHALRRRLPTLTWGQVDFHLVYGDGLEEIWLTVGKSGTEVQSLGEATCRLINLLLASGVPISKIVREIRGIRGADSEGLGPNRFLGLADLIGKVLQEAPEQYGTAQIADDPTSNITSNLSVAEAISTSPQPSVLESVASTVCPDCSAELQQVNGCKGGACIVCGYSSCS